ncbi:MAG: DUF3656 domain-containing protein [Methanobrevibacter sp.]|uniref:U32 family peptidase n=1 Tax=Methanobrevibacter sp. TaxID=66852 RepID=UPI0026E02351|nr:U32 family peptidase [Methanobrevibacter sp.]MDO5848978.1 DUF3656 domain-containing protein [Methanobrevibacter sp.]
MKLPELLAPIGSMDHLKVAVNAGASSIYLSGKDYGARKYAENFTIDEIEDAVKFAHLHNVKVYVTVNTLIKEDEIENVLNYLNQLYGIGVDAVLIQDLGLVDLINKYIPDLEIHGSTQMNIENQLKIDYLENKGIKRIVLPREMNKNEIRNLKTDMELEIFAHGALCYSYSGQCLFSSMKGGRSGNRGSCAQPCRQKYTISDTDDADYYLSLKDLSLFDYLDEIIELGIDCIKIEGRMRNKEYLAIVISEYRKALNKIKSRKKLESENIDLVFNRGFTPGQFKRRSSRSMHSGHVGLELGTVYNVNNDKIAIMLKDNIKTIPEKGDGLLILDKTNKYGFEISQNPIVTTLNHFKKNRIKALKDINRKDRILIIKQVRHNKKANFNLEGSVVYLNKRNKLSKKTKEIENDYASYIKSPLNLTFSVKNNYPVLKGTLKLKNRKIAETVTGKTPFETPLKKAVDIETVKKQLSKLDNYPFKIQNININYNGDKFIPISELNKLRRELLSKLENNIDNHYKNEIEPIDYNPGKPIIIEKECSLSYYANDLEHLDKIKNVSRVYLEIPPEKNLIYNFEKKQPNINYMVKFIEDAMNVAKDKDYELIWKWPDIAHDSLIKTLNKVKGILNKKNIRIPIMSPNFNCEYGPYSLNVTNSETVNGLDHYKIVTLSPELDKKDYKDIISHVKDNRKAEILVQGNLELMKTRNKLLKKSESKTINPNNIKNTYLIDKKGNKYLIKENLSNEELIIFNNEEISLLEEIPYLKSVNYINFAIDGRWKDSEYTKMIDIYNSAINEDKINKKSLQELSAKNTKGNY